MPSQLAEAIRQLTQEKGISEEAVLRTIENTLKAAYKRAFGTSDNCIVRFSEDNSSVEVFSRKVIVDGVYDPVVEIELEDALKLYIRLCQKSKRTVYMQSTKTKSVKS